MNLSGKKKHRLNIQPFVGDLLNLEVKLERGDLEAALLYVNLLREKIAKTIGKESLHPL